MCRAAAIAPARSIDGASDNEDRADRAIVDVARAPLSKSAAEVH